MRRNVCFAGLLTMAAFLFLLALGMYAAGSARAQAPAGRTGLPAQQDTSKDTPAGAVTATPCVGTPVVITGTIETADPDQTGRLNRYPTPSVCGTPRTCPDYFVPDGARSYDQYSFPNDTSGNICVTITANTPCIDPHYIFVVAYLDTFDPNSLCSSYLGDMDESPNPTASFSVDVPSGHTLILVVHEITPGQGCPTYRLTIEGLPCEVTPTPTATSTSTATSSPTVTGTSTPTVTSTPCAIDFTDVHESDYFYEDVRCVYCLGAVSGYSDGTFRPFNNTTRGQMTKIIVLALQIPIATPSGTPTFNDVAPGSAFYDYVETAAGRGIVSGYSDGTFRPNNNVTRGQLSKIDVIAANQEFGWDVLNPATPTFTDVSPGSAFYTYVETAVCHGIISGYSDNTFRPNNNAIRAQIAKIVCRTSQNPADNCTGTATPILK